MKNSPSKGYIADYNRMNAVRMFTPKLLFLGFWCKIWPLFTPTREK